MTHSHPHLLAQFFTLDPELITAISIIVILIIIGIVLLIRKKPSPTITKDQD